MDNKELVLMGSVIVLVTAVVALLGRDQSEDFTKSLWLLFPRLFAVFILAPIIIGVPIIALVWVVLEFGWIPIMVTAGIGSLVGLVSWRITSSERWRSKLTTICDTCQASLPIYGSFCTTCGARRRRHTKSTTVKRDFVRWQLIRLGTFVRRQFRSEAERRFDAIYENIHPNSIDDQSLFDLEDLLRDSRTPRALRDTISRLLPTFYLIAAQNMTLGIIFPRYESEAEELLARVRAVRKSRDQANVPLLFDAESLLNKDFNEALSKYEEAARLGHPAGYTSRASSLVSAADGALLRLYHISSPRMGQGSSQRDNKPVHHGNVFLGNSFSQEAGVVDYADELVWLYEQAKADYEKALTIDSTDSEACLALAKILQRFGQTQQAVTYLDRALAILNRALQADERDESSYLERAEVFEQLGNVNQAIADLEQCLTLTTLQFKAQSVRERIDRLRQTVHSPDAGGPQNV